MNCFTFYYYYCYYCYIATFAITFVAVATPAITNSRYHLLSIYYGKGNKLYLFDVLL